MKATQELHEMGQSLWLDNITRGLLTSGTLRRYIQEFSVTGLTSNPTIFDHAIKNSHDYDDAIRQKVKDGEVARSAVLRAGAGGPQTSRRSVPADPRSDERRGWLGVAGGLAPARERHGRHHHGSQGAPRPGGTAQSLHQDPGNPEGLPAIEEAIFAGVPINVTLLFSREQYVAAAEAYLRGIERRLAAGLNPDVVSVASLFVSRWDVAVMGKAPRRCATGSASRSQSGRTRRTATCSTRRAGSACRTPARGPATPVGQHRYQGPEASDVLYIKALAAPLTINTIPESTLESPGRPWPARRRLPADGGDCEEVLTEFTKAGIDIDALAARLQEDGAIAFVRSWDELMKSIASKGEATKVAG